MSAPVLTTLEALKIHLGITETGEDQKLTQWLIAADKTVERFTGRKLASQQHTEYFDGNGRPLLVLTHRPVTAITSVHVDHDGYYGHGASAFPAATEWTLGTDFAPKRLDESEENGGILLALKSRDFAHVEHIDRGVWPCGNGNIKVVYTAGYTDIPEDVQEAVWLLVAEIRKMAEKNVSGPLAGETFGRYSYTLLAGSFAGVGGALNDARAKLSGYTEVSW